MSAILAGRARELIDRPSRRFTRDDGSPRTCVMSVARDGDDLPMSTKPRRPQHRNLQRRPRASIVARSRELPRRSHA